LQQLLEGSTQFGIRFCNSFAVRSLRSRARRPRSLSTPVTMPMTLNKTISAY
jgi:hypothetical protein